MQRMMKVLGPLRTVVIGMILGLANVIPGVSGGTMAVVFGIYPQLLSLMAIDWKEIRKQLPFYILLVVGMGLGILVFSQGLEYLLGNHPMPTNYFFIGIILGSLPMLWKRATDNSKLQPSAIVACIIAFAIMLLLPLLQNQSGAQAALTTLNFQTFMLVFAGGVIAAISMIIPGISGSLILVVVGLYATFIGSISDFAKMLPVWLGLRDVSAAGDRVIFIIPVALGVLVGLVIGSRLVRWLLARYPRITYGFIFGLVAASPFAIFPGFAFNWTGLISVVALGLGVCLTLAFGREKAD